MFIELVQDYLLPVLFFTGLLAGTIDAIAGGGGLISLPVLMGVGVPPHIALGTNKLQGLFGTASAAYSYYKKGLLRKQGLFIGIAYSFAGAITGAIISQLVSSDFLKKIIPILLLLVLLYTFLSPKLGTQESKPKLNEKWFYLIFGTLLGFYDGFLGPGVGSFWVIALVIFLGHNLLRATAYTKVFNFNTNAAAVICFALGNHIDYKLALVMAMGQLIGGRLGAYFTIKKGVRLIRPVFLFVVSATISTLIYRNYSQSNDFLSFIQQPKLIFISLLVMTSFLIIYIRILLKRRKALLQK